MEMKPGGRWSTKETGCNKRLEPQIHSSIIDSVELDFFLKNEPTLLVLECREGESLRRESEERTCHLLNSVAQHIIKAQEKLNKYTWMIVSDI